MFQDQKLEASNGIRSGAATIKQRLGGKPELIAGRGGRQRRLLMRCRCGSSAGLRRGERDTERQAECRERKKGKINGTLTVSRCCHHNIGSYFWTRP